jgi:hypothetical protein
VDSLTHDTKDVGVSAHQHMKNKGPKQVTCSICNETVSKRSTRLLGDGTRACKSHDGVLEESEGRLQKEKENARAKAEAERDRFLNNRRNHYAPSDLRAKCCVCNKPGLRQDFFIKRILIAQAKLHQQGGPHPMLIGLEQDPEKRKALHQKFRETLMSPDATDDCETRCLFVRKVPEDKQHKFWKLASDNALMAAQILGVFMICGPCAEKIAIDVRNHEHEERVKKMYLQQMAVLGQMFEETVGKAVTAEAIGELAAEDAMKMEEEK